MLLTVVLAVWGIIGFKIISTINPDAPEVSGQNIAINFNPKTTTLIDTFSVQTAERDPFLGTLSLKQKSKSTNTKSSTKIKSTVIWVPVLYHGAIAKQNSNTKVFVISIEGQQYVLKIGQEIKGVKLIRANPKEIIVSYKGVKKTILKV